MDAKAAAPTITIDGVTSKPAEPASFVTLDCGNITLQATHVIEVGDPAICEDGPHEDSDSLYCRVVKVLKTWSF